MTFQSTTVAIFLAFILLASCKEEEQVLPPVIEAVLSPASGNTTQKFSFDLSGSDSRTNLGTKLFTRWDWDGDGNWDTPFTRLLVYEHRYYAPGIWKPRLEMSNLSGTTDTLTLTIPVARGYSPPKPFLIMTPVKGHIYTSFRLDASATCDDEDSLNQLSFRWDFEGDGQWDTAFGDSLIRTRIYPETGYYNPKVQVRDPSGLISSGDARIQVSLTDTRLKVTFKYIPDSITNNTPVIMDASECSDPDFPDKPLLYRWDWNNDFVWDTGWLTDPRTEHVFQEEFFHFVKLEIRSSRGLVNEITQKVRVYHKNTPPSASFVSSTISGNIKTQFRFDCWSTRDAESSPSAMSYRWDFDGDGSWDTDFVKSVITIHQYDRPGTFKTLMEVEDVHGGRDTCSTTIYISHGTNQTGILEDPRGIIYESYGTVLIGDQWWFTRNFAGVLPRVGYISYPKVPDYYLNFGYLYGPIFSICPPGWRLPSREDWEKLFSNYPEDQLYEALMPGGESDFSALLGGTGSGSPQVSSNYHGIGKSGHYWSTTKPQGTSSTSIWEITFDKKTGKVLQGYNPGEGPVKSVRCVREK